MLLNTAVWHPRLAELENGVSAYGGLPNLFGSAGLGFLDASQHVTLALSLTPGRVGKLSS